MKIRDKLLLSFGMYVLLAVILGFFSYKELSTIKLRLLLVEKADDMTNTILEIRRYEKNYLLYNDQESFITVKRYLDLLKNNLASLSDEIKDMIGLEGYENFMKNIAEYETLFERLADNLRQQRGLIEEFGREGRRIERFLRGEDLRLFLVLRRYEKNLLLYKDIDSYNTFIKTCSGLNRIAYPEIKRYCSIGKSLFEYFQVENENTTRMRVKAREIQSFTEDLSRKERNNIEAVVKRSMNILVYTIAAIIVLGTIINIILARGISGPIKRLERITKKIAMGDLSEHLKINGNDEIASLAASFETMQERLQDTLDSLEHTIKILHEKQAQLVESEKLASIGILASGIAHEINNPLTSILTFSNLILEQMSEDDSRYERVKMMARQASKARDIVRQLLSFAKEIPYTPVRMSVNQPVSEIIESLVAQDAFKEIELKVNLSSDLPEIPIDPVRIGQVVLNIILNAIQSITPPGRIEVSTQVRDNFVEIVISDTGSGIPEDKLNRIFDPFFTTKEGGTGLGLAVSYGIVKRHGGDIEVKSSVGKGSTFIVRLPIDRPEVAQR